MVSRTCECGCLVKFQVVRHGFSCFGERLNYQLKEIIEAGCETGDGCACFRIWREMMVWTKVLINGDEEMRKMNEEET